MHAWHTLGNLCMMMGCRLAMSALHARGGSIGSGRGGKEAKSAVEGVAAGGAVTEGAAAAAAAAEEAAQGQERERER
jgi:hypothetical protein